MKGDGGECDVKISRSRCNALLIVFRYSCTCGYAGGNTLFVLLAKWDQTARIGFEDIFSGAFWK